jgi:hypothetical protein
VLPDFFKRSSHSEADHAKGCHEREKCAGSGPEEGCCCAPWSWRADASQERTSSREMELAEASDSASEAASRGSNEANASVTWFCCAVRFVLGAGDDAFLATAFGTAFAAIFAFVTTLGRGTCAFGASTGAAFFSALAVAATTGDAGVCNARAFGAAAGPTWGGATIAAACCGAGVAAEVRACGMIACTSNDAAGVARAAGAAAGTACFAAVDPEFRALGVAAGARSGGTIVADARAFGATRGDSTTTSGTALDLSLALAEAAGAASCAGSAKLTGVSGT